LVSRQPGVLVRPPQVLLAHPLQVLVLLAVVRPLVLLQPPLPLAVVRLGLRLLQQEDLVNRQLVRLVHQLLVLLEHLLLVGLGCLLLVGLALPQGVDLVHPQPQVHLELLRGGPLEVVHLELPSPRLVQPQLLPSVLHLGPLVRPLLVALEQRQALSARLQQVRLELPPLLVRLELLLPVPSVEEGLVPRNLPWALGPHRPQVALGHLPLEDLEPLQLEASALPLLADLELLLLVRLGHPLQVHLARQSLHSAHQRLEGSVHPLLADLELLRLEDLAHPLADLVLLWLEGLVRQQLPRRGACLERSSMLLQHLCSKLCSSFSRRLQAQVGWLMCRAIRMEISRSSHLPMGQRFFLPTPMFQLRKLIRTMLILHSDPC